MRILATSREPLAIPGEQVVRLQPLATTPNGTAVPPAVELFLDRAATHGAVWEDPERMLPTIQEICARLDGIPLAIELAAARAAAMSPAQLLTRLDDRFRLLARPRHSSAAARQQTLEAAIAWSYDLLSAPERATLRRLAVFQGGFFLAAAAAVCADTGSELDTVERVTALVDRSVVSIERRDDDDRYRLLESIGLFATSRLREQAEIDRARDRHAAFFLNLVRRAPDELHGREQPARVDQLDIEQDNIAHALAWCLDGKGDPDVGAELAAAIGWHWIGRGRSNLARRWLARALELGEQVGAANLIALHVAYAVLAYATGNIAANDLDFAGRRVPEVFGMYRDQQRWADLGGLLWVAAEIEFKRGSAERSAVLIGASQRWTYQLDFQDELLLPELAKLRDGLTASLGSDAFAGAAQRGATMELAEVAGFLAVDEARTPA